VFYIQLFLAVAWYFGIALVAVFLHDVIINDLVNNSRDNYTDDPMGVYKDQSAIR
jgi:hypothetical protein